MNYIELMGPQGAGKTTLMRKLVMQRENGADWCTFDEAISEIADQVHWEGLSHWDQRLYWILRKADLFGVKRNGLSNKLIKCLRREEDLDVKKKYEYLIEAQIKAVAELEIGISPINLFYLLSWNYKALDRSFLLEEFNFGKTVLMDEGPFKTHYGLRYINPAKVIKDTLPAAVLYSTIDKKLNVERILDRFEKTGKFSRIHNRINKADLPEVTDTIHKISEENITVIR
jgi:hypothetical protein